MDSYRSTISSRLLSIKVILYGDSSGLEKSSEAKQSEVAKAMIESLYPFFPNLIKSLSRLPFEARKDFAAIFNYLLRQNLEKVRIL